jgi:malate dehydrogenase
MTRDDLFNTNASIVRDLVAGCAEHCPKAHILIIANPVNSTVPIAAEVLKKKGVYDPQRLFGVTTLDITRANTFLGEVLGRDPRKLNVPVIGGHSGITIIPLFSQVKDAKLTQDQINKLTHRVQFGGDEVVKAKDGAGSATLSMAYAADTFTASLIRALDGEKGVVECTFVQQEHEKTAFFSLPVELGINGVEKVRPRGNLSAFEKDLYEKALADLTKNIDAGVKFVSQK